MEEKLKQINSSCKKVVLYGPESTGKTTLAIELAKYYNVKWVPEFARQYLQNIWDKEKRICQPSDIMPIAYGQMKIENELAKNSETLLICDTNIFETMVYSKYYYGGTCDPLLKKYAMLNHYDLYLLTDIDIPWEKDDLRDKPNEREYSMKIFKDELEKNNLNYRLISGTKEKRLKIAIKYINDLIKFFIFNM